MWSSWEHPMNFSQKPFLLFTFLKCNVVHLRSWTARIKAFVLSAGRKRDSEGGMGWGPRTGKFKACEVKLEGHSLDAFPLPA